MGRRSLRRYVAPAALLGVLLTGCGSDGDSEGGPVDPAPSSSPTSSPTAPSTSSGGSEDASPNPTPSQPAPSGGTADEPTEVTPTTSLLAWRPVPGSVQRTVTRSGAGDGAWSLSVAETGASAMLTGPDTSLALAAPGRRVSDALLDDEYAVVVLQDKAEERPAVARIIDLGDGKASTIDARSDLPTTNGGTWALEGDQLVHATYSRGAYCLASVDLPSGTSTLGWCAPKRHGFSNAHLTPAGTSMLTFDDGQPACRTVVAVAGTEASPFTGVPDCSGWDGQLLDDGAIWSIIPKERQIDSAHFYGRAGEGYVDLGPGSSGTLTWCAGASYFARNPQRAGDPAALMRWTAEDGLAVVYESPAGQAFLDRPRCGGNAITVTAFAQAGDEQVTAALP